MSLHWDDDIDIAHRKTGLLKHLLSWCVSIWRPTQPLTNIMSFLWSLGALLIASIVISRVHSHHLESLNKETLSNVMDITVESGDNHGQKTVVLDHVMNIIVSSSKTRMWRFRMFGWKTLGGECEITSLMLGKPCKWESCFVEHDLYIIIQTWRLTQ